ncbi:MAG: hypothetical protein HY481_00750 [Candidatus Vogelbacteria bacterium]|nr:hypothetical protein [Candidatus Vogelbacteria bacterium]
MERNSSRFKFLSAGRRITLLLLVFSFTFCVPAVLAAVAKLEFVTPARVAAPGALSESLTVQTQNSAGASEKITETADVTFISSSPTGEFLNDKGDPVRLVMASSTANRSFYYRDSTPGEHTLTVTVAGRSGSWSVAARQTITVGQVATEPPPSPDPEPPPTPPVVESPPPDLGRQASNGSLASNQSTTSTAPVTTAPPAPASTSTLVASMVAPIPPAGPATDVRAAELARLGNELARTAAKLQTAQKEKPRETKATEPKTLEIDHASLAAALVPSLPAGESGAVEGAVIEIPKPPSFLQRLAAIPRKIWQLVKNLFRRS